MDLDKKFIRQILKNIKSVYLIGVTGIPGSGKTTYASKSSSYLKQRYKNYQVILIDSDLYMKHPRDQKIKKVAKMNSYKNYWDIFQLKELAEDLKKTKNKISFKRKNLYFRKTGKMEAELEINFNNKKSIVIIEGILVIHPRLINYFDQVIFIDTNPNLCLERKKQRANYRSLEETIWLFKNFEQPLFDACKKDLLKRKNLIRIVE